MPITLSASLQPGDIVRPVSGGKWLDDIREPFAATTTWIKHHNDDWPFELVAKNSMPVILDVSDPHCLCRLCKVLIRSNK